MPCTTRSLQGEHKLATPKKSAKVVKSMAKAMGKQRGRKEKSAEPTAYERLFEKVQDNRRKREATQNEIGKSPVKKVSKAKHVDSEVTLREVEGAEHIQFLDEDNVMDMMVGEKQDAEFPSQSEEDDDESEDGEITDAECEPTEDSFNNNATAVKESAQSSAHVDGDLEHSS